MKVSTKKNVQREVKHLRYQLRVIMKDIHGHIKCLQRVIKTSEHIAKCAVLHSDIYALWHRVWLTISEGSPTYNLSKAKVMVQELRNKVDEFGHYSMCLTFEMSPFIPPVVSPLVKASSSSDTIVNIEGGDEPGDSRLAHGNMLPQWVAKLMLGLSGQMVIQLLMTQANDRSPTAKVVLAFVKVANAVGFICLLLGLNICRRRSLAASANVLQRIGVVLVAIGLILAMTVDLPVSYVVMCTLLLGVPVTIVLSAM